uniref:Major facilitator superfamily (MFS) profile domain-containing protein n=1 Tax=Ditylenchus dipsaci TaxID=166011 RepID=A0A915DFD6_9BILA
MNLKKSSSSSSSHLGDALPSTTKQSETNLMVETERLTSPDQVLSRWGTRNVYLWSVWISMALVWGLSAMPMMVSAFIMGGDDTTASTCVSHTSSTNSTSNCVATHGTIAKEFGLSGSKAALVEYTTSAFLFGVVVGSTFLPLLSDRKGRRLVLLLSMSSMGVAGCASAFAPDIYSFTLLRFIQGVFFTGCGVTNWILAYECIPMRLRSYTALVFGIMWVAGYCLVGPLAYWLPDWRQLIIATSSPILLFALIYFFTIPESFHYLVSQGEVNKVEQWMKKANNYANQNARAQFSAKDLCDSSRLSATQCKLKENGSYYTPKQNLVHELLSSRLLSIYTLIMVYLWTCDTFVYYGLSLFSTQISGDRYLNFALMGLIEIPSYLISPIMLNRIGRRLFVSLCHLLAATSFFAILFADDPRISLIIWLIGKFAISSAFTSLFVYASEVFPTVVRNGCIGICSVVARVGGAFAPTVRTMSLISPIIPPIFFGTSAGLGALLTLLLPETSNRELPCSTDHMTGAIAAPANKVNAQMSKEETKKAVLV